MQKHAVNKSFVRVRYADTDRMGIAYNGIYFTWFEIGRTELLRGTGTTYKDVEHYGIKLPLIKEGIIFLKPAHYDDVLSIVTYIERLKGVRIRFNYEIWRDEEKLATGYTEFIIARDEALISSLGDYGFTPGLLAAAGEPGMKHEGLYSLFMNILIQRYGRGDRRPPPYLPGGFTASPIP